MEDNYCINLLKLVFLLLLIVLLSIVIVFFKLGYSALSTKNQTYIDYPKYIKVTYEYDSSKEYIDYTSQRMSDYEKERVKDKNGILLTEYKEEYVYDIKEISHYGLTLFGKYIQNNDYDSFELAKKQADYLISVQDQETGKFLNNYEFLVIEDKSKKISKKYKLKEGWISSSSQAYAISLLSRVYTVSLDDKYKQAALLALLPFKSNMDDGGFRTKLFGHTFYDEYILENEIYSLSGFMSSLISFYDAYKTFDDEGIKEMYEDGINTLEFCLPYYDSDKMSMQNLAFIKNPKINRMSDIKYHIIHLYQLKVLDYLNNSDIIDYFYTSWSRKTENK